MAKNSTSNFGKKEEPSAREIDHRELAVGCLEQAEEAALKLGGVALCLAGGEAASRDDAKALTLLFGEMMGALREARANVEEWRAARDHEG